MGYSRNKAGKRVRHSGLSDEHIGAEYTEDEIEFIKAVEAWMKKYKKRFPTFTDLLSIAKSLGYRKKKK